MPSVETSTRDTDKNLGITVLEKRGGLGSGAQKKARGSAGGEAGQGEEGEQTGEEEEGRGGGGRGEKRGMERRCKQPLPSPPGQQTQHPRPHEGDASISFKMRREGRSNFS